MKTSLSLYVLVICASVEISVILALRPEGQEWNIYQRILPVIYPGRCHATSEVVGGNAASLGQFPYQAAVSIDDFHSCGGSVISSDYVLTAAHCCAQGNSFTITLGVINENLDASSRLVVRSTESHVHEQFDPKSLHADLCLLKLEQSISFNDNIKPISLPPMSNRPPRYDDTAVIASGWGKTSDSADGISPTLQFTHLTTITNDECSKFYGGLISDSQICAKGDNDESTCQGDSGGPLVAAGPLLIGVISFGSVYGCESGYPSVYTRVTTYRQWLHDNAGV